MGPETRRTTMLKALWAGGDQRVDPVALLLEYKKVLIYGLGTAEYHRINRLPFPSN